MRIKALWAAWLLLACDEPQRCEPALRVITNPDEVVPIGWDPDSRAPLVRLTPREAARQVERREVCLALEAWSLRATPAEGPDAEPVVVHLEVPPLDLGDIEARWQLACFHPGGSRTLTLDYVWAIVRSSARPAGAIALQGQVNVSVDDETTVAWYRASVGCADWAAPPCVDPTDTLDINLHVWDPLDESISGYVYRYGELRSFRSGQEGEVVALPACADLVAATPFDPALISQ